MINKFLTAVAFILLATSSFAASYSTLAYSEGAKASIAAGFEAGLIIDDSVMRNNNSMTTSQIQTFLNSKLPSCDTWGAKAYSSTQTRKQYAASRGVSTPFTCLKDYKESGKTSAQLIKEKADKYGINPQVLIVLLQKEQGLVTDDWPWPVQYRTATGYGCPDTAPCDSQYYGLANQLDWAAKMFKSIVERSPDWYSPYVAGYNPKVYWHPDTSRCGGQSLNIQNWSTASLYSYTPYRPNQAALDAGYGEGNSCSSYGNRNFYLYFKDWFGNPKGHQLSVSVIDSNKQPFVEEPVRAKILIKNNSKYTISLGRLKFQAINNADSSIQYHFDSAWDVSIGPGKTYTYDVSHSIDKEGSYTIELVRHNNNRWYVPPFTDYGLNQAIKKSVVVTKVPTISHGLVMPHSTHQNADTQAKFTIRNNSALYPVNVGRTKVEGRHSDGTQHDFPSTPSELVLDPGASYSYSEISAMPKKGEYAFRLMNFRSGIGWSGGYPASNSPVSRTAKVAVKDPATVTKSLSMSASSSRIGENVTAKFEIRNHSNNPVNVGRTKVEGRHSDGTQHDFESTPNNLTLQPGQVYSYSSTRSLPKSGSYEFKLMNYRDKIGWSGSFPINEAGYITRSQKLEVKEQVTITESLKLSTSSVRQGEALTATFKMANHSSMPINIGRIKVEGRHSDGTQYDFSSTPNNLTLQPGQVYSYNSSRELPKSGVYTFKLMNYHPNHHWSATYPANENSDIVRSQKVTVKDAVTVVQSLQINPSAASTGQPLTATFKMKNHSTKAINIGRMKVEGRDSRGAQYDFGSTPSNLTLQPGQTYSYSSTRSLSKTDSYTFKLMNYHPNHHWSASYPENETTDIIRQIKVMVR